MYDPDIVLRVGEEMVAGKREELAVVLASFPPRTIELLDEFIALRVELGFARFAKGLADAGPVARALRRGATFTN